VTANNEPKGVLTVNRAFKGVYLDKPGNYHIEFIYRPRHWRLACCLFWDFSNWCHGACDYSGPLRQI
jgi:hypothetical protein